MNNILYMEYDNGIIFTNDDGINIDNTDEKYVVYKNFETLVKNIKAWEIDIKLNYDKKTMKGTKNPFLILGNYIKLYLAGYTNDGRELYQIDISKEFLNQENDAIIFVLGFKYVKYTNGYLEIYYTDKWNDDYLNQNNKIIINTKEKKIIINIGEFLGNISLIKLDYFHVKNFNIDKIYLVEHKSNVTFNINRIILKRETNMNNLAFEYVYEEE